MTNRRRSQKSLLSRSARASSTTSSCGERTSGSGWYAASRPSVIRIAAKFNPTPISSDAATVHARQLSHVMRRADDGNAISSGSLPGSSANAAATRSSTTERNSAGAPRGVAALSRFSSSSVMAVPFASHQMVRHGVPLYAVNRIFWRFDVTCCQRSGCSAQDVVCQSPHPAGMTAISPGSRSDPGLAVHEIRRPRRGRSCVRRTSHGRSIVHWLVLRPLRGRRPFFIISGGGASLTPG